MIQMLKQTFSRFIKDEAGATMIEYGLIVGLVSVVAIAILTTVGGTLITLFTRVNAALVAAL